MSPSQLFAAGGPRRAAHPDRHLRTRRPPTPDRDARLPGSLPPPRGDAVSARGQAAAVARRRRHPARDAQRDHAAAGADAFVASLRATRPSGRGGRRAAQPPSLLPGGPTVTRRPYGMYRYTQGRASRSHLPFHFQVDEQFTTLRWSWTESLLLDEILSIDYSAGSTSFTIQYFQQDLTHGAAKISLSLVCRTIEDAARWVRALSGLQRVEAVQHNLDVSKRARLKRAFRTATKEPRLRLAQQIAFFSCTRPSEPDPPLTFDDRPTTCCFSPHPPRVESRCRTRAGLGACWAPCALRVPSPRFESRARGRRAAGVRQRHHAPAALWPARLVARPVEDLRSARGQPGGQGILPAGYEFMRPKGPHYPRFTISASHLLANATNGSCFGTSSVCRTCCRRRHSATFGRRSSWGRNPCATRRRPSPPRPAPCSRPPHRQLSHHPRGPASCYRCRADSSRSPGCAVAREWRCRTCSVCFSPRRIPLLVRPPSERTQQAPRSRVADVSGVPGHDYERLASPQTPIRAASRTTCRSRSRTTGSTRRTTRT